MKLILALFLCFAYTPLGMPMLQGLGYPPRFFIGMGTLCGDLFTVMLWAIAYHDFSRIAPIKNAIESAQQWIEKHTPLAPGTDIKSLSPNAAVACTSFLNIQIALTTGRLLSVPRHVALFITLGVSSVRDVTLGVMLVGMNFLPLIKHFKWLGFFFFASWFLMSWLRNFFKSPRHTTAETPSLLLEKDSMGID